MPLITLTEEQKHSLKKYNPALPTDDAKLDAYVVAAIKAALDRLLEIHEKQKKIVAETTEDTNEVVDMAETSVIIKDIDSVMVSVPQDSSLADEIDEQRPDLFYKLNQEQKNWIYAQLPGTLKHATLTEALIAEALYAFSLKKEKDDNNMVAGILKVLPHLSDKVNSLKEKRSMKTLCEQWVKQFASKTVWESPENFQLKALDAVHNWLKNAAGNWRNDQASFRYVAYLMREFPLVAKKLAQAQIDTYFHSDLYNYLLQFNNLDSALTVIDGAQAWLENLPCHEPMSKMTFNKGEPVAQVIARSKLKTLIEKDPAWAYIQKSPILMKLALEAQHTTFWPLLTSGFRNLFGFKPRTFQERLSVDDFFALASSLETSMEVKQALKNAIVTTSWWERTLNAIGIPAGLNGKMSAKQRTALLLLCDSRPPVLPLKEKNPLSVTSIPVVAEVTVKPTVQQTLNKQIEGYSRERLNKTVTVDKSGFIPMETLKPAAQQQGPEVLEVVEFDLIGNTSGHHDRISFDGNDSGHQVDEGDEDDQLILTQVNDQDPEEDESFLPESLRSANLGIPYVVTGAVTTAQQEHPEGDFFELADSSGHQDTSQDLDEVASQDGDPNDNDRILADLSGHSNYSAGNSTDGWKNFKKDPNRSSIIFPAEQKPVKTLEEDDVYSDKENSSFVI